MRHAKCQAMDGERRTKGSFGSRIRRGLSALPAFRLFTELVEPSRCQVPGAGCQSPAIHPLMATNATPVHFIRCGELKCILRCFRFFFAARSVQYNAGIRSFCCLLWFRINKGAASSPLLVWLLFLPALFCCRQQQQEQQQLISPAIVLAKAAHTCKSGLYINVLHTFQRRDLCTSNSGWLLHMGKFMPLPFYAPRLCKVQRLALSLSPAMPSHVCVCECVLHKTLAAFVFVFMRHLCQVHDAD